MARREKLAADLVDVEAALGAAGGGVAAEPAPAPLKRGPGRPPKVKRGPGRPKGKRGRKAGAKGESDLHNAIRAALTGASEPMKLADIAAKVQADGYATKSKNFAVIVGNRLAEMKDVVKPGRGIYAMK